MQNQIQEKNSVIQDYDKMIEEAEKTLNKVFFIFFFLKFYII